MHERVENVGKIAVLRANALGDYIFALPALDALKQAYPDAELVYLGNAWHRDFLAARPGPVDRVVVVPKYKGIPHESDIVEDQREVNSFIAAMHAESFDIALQMHGGGGNSNPFIRKLGARVTAGFRASDAPPLDRCVAYFPYHNEIMRYFEAVGLVGARPVTVEPRLALTARDYHELDVALPGLRKPYAVLHPGASDVRRRWPTDKMGALADALVARGLHVYVTGVEDESEVTAEVVRQSGNVAEDICGQLSLCAMTGLLAQAELVVSNDTGPLHLARAVGSRTIGIYWIGNVINAGPITMQDHRYCMSWTTCCPLCGMDCVRHDAHEPRDGCNHDASFLNAVGVDEVLEHAEGLLGESSVLAQRAAV